MSVLLNTPVITSVRLRGLDSYNFPFTPGMVAQDDDMIIKNIDGLDPPSQNVAIAKTASGGKYQGVEAEDRELIFLISLNKNSDVKALRNNLYTMLRTGHDPKVWVDFMSGSTFFASCEGYVTRFEAPQFVKDPAVQITFRMLHPTFRAPVITKLAPSQLSENAPNIYNPGTAETGFQFAVKFTGSMAHWYIRTAENQSIGMVFDNAFVSGDLLEVSTIPGQKYVHLKKPGKAVKNKLGILRADSEWLSLHPGHNHFVMPSGTNWNWQGNLSFRAQYWGL